MRRRRKKRKQLKTNRDFTEGRCRTGKSWNVKQEEGLTKKKGKSKGTRKEMRRKGILAR